MWAGIAGSAVNNNTNYEVAISIHDSVYNTDFASSTIPYNPNDPEGQAVAIEKHILDLLRKFSTEHMCKFLGAGVTVSLLREVRSHFPTICYPTSRAHAPTRVFPLGKIARVRAFLVYGAAARNPGKP